MSAAGQAASPSDIIASCQALQAHIQKVQDDAIQILKNWEESLREQELAEKRRVAPGWLDRDEKILEPEKLQSAGVSRIENSQTQSIRNSMEWQNSGSANEAFTGNVAGDELDRAFGGMTLRKE